MSEVVEAVMEFLLAIIGSVIYGTEEKPRHPIWRNSVRIIAFTGAFIMAGSLLNLFGGFAFPFPIILIWAFCSLIVLSAEYYAGSKTIGLVALGVFVTILAIVIITST